MTLQDADTQWIELDGAVNARAVVPGVLLRSDNLQDLSERDVSELVGEHRLEVVLDLRTEVEVTLEGPGPLISESRVRVAHHSLYPSQGNTDVDADTIKPGTRPWGSDDAVSLPDETPLVRAYLGYMYSRPDSVVAAVREIATADGATLVHCAAGKDRTGTIVAVALEASGATRELIAEDYLASGERIEQIMERLCSSDTYRQELEGHDPQRHAPVPGTIERVLEIVDAQHGGAAGWLLANGLTETELALLRERLAPAVGS
ncbi:MAG TPA: tyrosine-protein phosphatase [Solirubrobacteraceae bacterium]|nr:tyrosine-protein phosphatase [Solirubrobacteraceae bacterium]